MNRTIEREYEDHIIGIEIDLPVRSGLRGKYIDYDDISAIIVDIDGDENVEQQIFDLSLDNFEIHDWANQEAIDYCNGFDLEDFIC